MGNISLILPVSICTVTVIPQFECVKYNYTKNGFSLNAHSHYSDFKELLFGHVYLIIDDSIAAVYNLRKSKDFLQLQKFTNWKLGIGLIFYEGVIHCFGTGHPYDETLSFLSQK